MDPASTVPDAPPALLAGVGRRAGGAAIDLAIVIGGEIVVALAGGIILAATRTASLASGGGGGTAAGAITLALAQTAFFCGPFTYLYLGWRRGATVGMNAVHCRLRAQDGASSPTAAQLTLRLCGLWLSIVPAGLGLLWGLFRQDRRGWSDLFARTAVVHVPPPAWNPFWHPAVLQTPPPPLPTAAQSQRTPWTWTDVVPVFVLLLPLSFGAEVGAVEAIKALLHGVALGTRRPIEAIASDIAAYGAVFLMVLLFVKVRRHASLAALGLRRVEWRWLVAALPFTSAAFILESITGRLSQSLCPQTPENQCESIRGGYEVLWLAVIGVALIAPLVEEIVFRGMIFGWLRGRVPIVWAVLVSAALFSLAHIGFLQLTLFLPVFSAGLLLAVLYTTRAACGRT